MRTWALGSRAVTAIGLFLVVSWVVVSPAVAATKTVRYGPYTIPAGTMEAPGMVHNKLRFAVSRPCLDCHITGFTPDLVYADGTPANLDTGPMLHHAVFTSQFRADATCSGTWLGLAGERFFATGNERTPIAFPAGYGYRVRWYDSWNLLVDLMNHSTAAKTVYLQVTYTYRPSWEAVKRVRPVWLDIDQCGDSEYTIPAGPSDTHWDWHVNVPGDVMAAFGHVHGHGVAVLATKGTADDHEQNVICRSDAMPDPDDVHSILEMSSCTRTPLATLVSGDTVRLHSLYNSSHPADDVMGIMLLFVHPS